MALFKAEIRQVVDDYLGPALDSGPYRVSLSGSPARIGYDLDIEVPRGGRWPSP